jgi:hypothetical protein
MENSKNTKYFSNASAAPLFCRAFHPTEGTTMAVTIVIDQGPLRQRPLHEEKPAHQ